MGKVGERLERPQFGMHRFEWPEDDGVEFHIQHSDWIRLLRANGFEILGLWELQAPESAEDHKYYDLVAAEWARKWPAEEIWKARKTRVSVPPAPPIVLASVSPQRRAILEQLDIPFDVVAAEYEEHDSPDADPSPLVREHAQGKARSVRVAGGVPGARGRHGGRRRRRGPSASPATRPRPRRCSSGCRAARTRSSPGSAW